MRKFVCALAATTVLGPGVVDPHAAQAENCWMAGCVGLIGYVYLPVRDTYPRDVVIGCKETPQFSPFGNKSLPDVNSVVTNEIGGTYIYSAGQIERQVKDFLRISIKTGVGGCEAELPISKPAPLGNVMRQGARVKILGYRTFHGEPEWWNDLPFALVMVVAD
jgi:hypothetical protein